MQAGWTLDSVNLPLPRESTKVSVEGPAGVGLQPGQMSGKVFCCLHAAPATRRVPASPAMPANGGLRFLPCGAEIPWEKRYI
ncbi:hypothetical protein MPL3365_100167 [Mesorhizobium plurifarium]|uniref:Uncharacterized protein n=1 Tax=Mesorhizobium plurifarium TaxID=69974 RepID=A0A090G107_MESPL|nr:hypothetical protein MPL3365_100167 [Mesorhizobium plurifarium]